MGEQNGLILQHSLMLLLKLLLLNMREISRTWCLLILDSKQTRNLYHNLRIRIGTALRKAVDMAEITLAQSGAISLEGTKRETAQEFDVR